MDNDNCKNESWISAAIDAHYLFIAYILYHLAYLFSSASIHLLIFIYLFIYLFIYPLIYAGIYIELFMCSM